MENTSLKKVAIIGYGGMGSWHAKYILGGGALELHRAVFSASDDVQDIILSLFFEHVCSFLV